MNNHKSIQILRGAESYDPATSEEILLDGQPFYSKKTKQLYIGDGVTPLKDLKSIDTGLNLATDDNLNTLVQSMEPGKNPNIAAGRSDVVFGRYNIGDSRTLNADGSVKDKGDSLFVAGVQNKNYGNRSAQFGSYNENHSLGSFQAGYSNKIIENTQYVAQFGTNNIAKHKDVFQTGSYNISGRDGQFQAGTLAEGNAENKFEVGGGGRFVKSTRDDSTLINDSYYIRTGDSYEKITADNIDSIPSTAQVYYLKNLFEINTDGTAKIAKQGDSENSLVIKKTLDNYKPIDSYEGTAGLSFSIISEEEKTCGVGKGTANSEEIIIPPYVFINGEQYTVTSIKNTGFKACANMRTIVIPKTVTKIGNQAFEGCTNLVNVKIPSSVTELGSTVFTNCDSLEEIEIPNSVTTITPMSGFPRQLFSHCNVLKKVTLGKNITNIPYQCFIGCSNLTDIIIKGEIKTVYNQAFNGVENATIWASNDLVDYYKNLLKKHTTLPIKPYRDLVGVNEHINDSGLFYHFITISLIGKTVGTGYNMLDELYFTVPMSTDKEINIDNLYDRLEGMVVIGSYYNTHACQIGFNRDFGVGFEIFEPFGVRYIVWDVYKETSVPSTEEEDHIYYTITDRVMKERK